jgi:hypothetical protein
LEVGEPGAISVSGRMSIVMKNLSKLLSAFSLLVGLAACNSTAVFPSPSIPAPSLTTTATVQPESSPTLSLVPATPINTPTTTPNPYQDPVGCLKPPDDYSRVEINGWTLNQRTFAMLQHAADLYQGPLEITGYAITQGSYHDNGAASWGTHLGGGAVDLSVMYTGTYTVAYPEIDPLLHALRTAGFAAWLRDYGEIYADSPIHIHAIAIGDAQLSQPAIDQLVGPAGYFYGFDGIPPTGDSPGMDRFGGPIVCKWMLDLGYPYMNLEAKP